MNHFLDLFEAASRRDPAAPALLAPSGAVSYGALRERARTLGARLGVKPGEVVALALPRTPDYATALLGTWYAGAVAVPLDPSLPRARREFILRDAGVRKVLERAEVRRRPCSPAGRSPSQAAYLIYTSGSTGRPKGVRVAHDALARVLSAQIPAFGLGPGARSFLYHSTAFDASLSDLGTALGSGAAIALEPACGLGTPVALRQALRRHAITHLDLPPSVLAHLLPADLAGVRVLILGGEASPPALLRRWARRLRVINVYGPTEAAICASLCRVDPRNWDRPLLGRPLPGVRFKTDGEELLIGGPTLAEGYHRLPELTAARFPVLCGERWYRTGDRVRRLPNGSFEFLGRVDRQAKLRGLRLEPEEVEAALLRAPGVGRAAVLVRPLGDRPGLVAFIEPRGRPTPTPGSLTQQLRQSLPAWMLPARYVFLPRLPETPSGKSDLGKLRVFPLPNSCRQQLSGPARIWSEVLNVSRIRPQDTFLGLGGDSLAALAAAARAEAAGIPFPSDWPAGNPTLAELERRMISSPDPGEAMPASLLDPPPPPWRAARADFARPMKNILLTGATGFLGSRVLKELLERTGATLYCLARRPPASKNDRVVWLRGDLEKPRLGLSRTAWNDLARRLDAVFHCAGRVNLLETFESLRGANLDGTREVLRLCASGRSKRLHYASTLSVLVSTDRGRGRLLESDDLSQVGKIYGGYAQTKWAAERLVRKAGLSAAVYRFGLLTGATDDGRFPANDLFGLLARGLARLGAVPRSAPSNLAVDLTPVDYAARAMVAVALRLSGSRPMTFHLANPRSLRLGALLAALRAAGRPVARVGEQAWHRRLLAAAPSASPALSALARALPNGAFARHPSRDLFQATRVVFDMREARATLAGSGLRCPAPDPALLRLYLGRLLGGRDG